MGWPDWRNPEGYPDPDLALPVRWAWEFLRRNPEYQAAFRQLSEEGRYYTVPGDANEIPYSELGLKVPTNGAEAFAAMTQGTSPKAPILEQKWGVKPIASPDVEDAWNWLSIEPAVIQLLGQESPRLPHPRLRETEILVKIDVAGPIEDQLKTAAYLLNLYRDGFKIKPYAQREHRHLWPRYLRILDARNEPKRPGWGAIASVFANEDPDSDWTERRARETHKAALALADRGWRFIASRHPDLEEPRQKKKAGRPAK